MPTQTRREDYTRALTEHVEKYPDHETAGDAYWMRGLFEEQRRQVTLALKAYREVPADHRRGPAAQIAVARCYEKILQRLADLEETAEDAQKPALRQKTTEWENAAAAELGQLMKSYPEEPRPLDHQQAEVGLILARLHLTRTEPNYSRADSLLERILVSGTQQKTGSEQADWDRILKTARQLRIVSLAGQGLSGRAEMLVKELSDSSTADVLGVMDGLMQVAKVRRFGHAAKARRTATANGGRTEPPPRPVKSHRAGTPRSLPRPSLSRDESIRTPPSRFTIKCSPPSPKAARCERESQRCWEKWTTRLV